MGSATAISSVVDAVANSNLATKKIGNRVRGAISSTGPTRIYHIQTPIPCPFGCTVTSAKLRLYQDTASTGSRTLSLRRISQNWKENQLSWKNRPSRISTVTDSVTLSGVGSQGRLIEFDVTADVQAFSDRAIANYGWTVESNSANEIAIFTSEAKRYQPRLIVTWSDRPETPTDLTPGGGGMVVIPKPKLRWSFVDLAGDTTLSGYQVHLKATNTGWSAAGGFASPGANTGIRDAISPELDLTTAGLTDILGTNGSMYWTVRHRDGAGLWSDWSDPTLVFYLPPQVVTLEAPGAVVTDTTFPWAWSVTDQAIVQMLILDASGHTLWNSGKIPNSALRSYTQPRGIIRRPGVTYRAVLRVWDSLNRQDVPGAPGYVQVVQDFTYADVDAVEPPQHLAVEPLDGRPGVRLTWTRVEMPDQFGIWVDGAEYRVEAASEFLISGTGYGIDILDLAPRTDHSIVVKAIRVDGGVTQASAAGVPLPVRVDPVGVWLIDPADPTLDVVMLQEGTNDIVTTTMPEVTAVFNPEGSSVTIPVTSALRWFEGSVSEGVLADDDLATAQAYRERLLEMKGNRLREYFLIWGTHVVPVYISNVNVQYVDVAAERYTVSFDFVASVPSPEYELS